MTELSGTGPLPVPYGGQHDGPRRTLVLNLRREMNAVRSVTVNIDGRDYPTPWGSAAFDIPADRPVSIAVYQETDRGRGGLATMVLQPGAGTDLEYRGGAYGVGSLGVPGTVRLKGGWVRIPFLIFFFLVLALFAFVVIGLLTGSFERWFFDHM